MKKGKKVEIGSIPDDWEARHDVGILKDALKIESDKKRKARADAYAKDEMERLEELLKGSKWGK